MKELSLILVLTLVVIAQGREINPLLHNFGAIQKASDSEFTSLFYLPSHIQPSEGFGARLRRFPERYDRDADEEGDAKKFGNLKTDQRFGKLIASGGGNSFDRGVDPGFFELSVPGVDPGFQNTNVGGSGTTEQPAGNTIAATTEAAVITQVTTVSGGGGGASTTVGASGTGGAGSGTGSEPSAGSGTGSGASTGSGTGSGASAGSGAGSGTAAGSGTTVGTGTTTGTETTTGTGSGAGSGTTARSAGSGSSTGGGNLTPNIIEPVVGNSLDPTPGTGSARLVVEMTKSVEGKSQQNVNGKTAIEASDINFPQMSEQLQNLMRLAGIHNSDRFFGTGRDSSIVLNDGEKRSGRITQTESEIVEPSQGKFTNVLRGFVASQQGSISENQGNQKISGRLIEETGKHPLRKAINIFVRPDGNLFYRPRVSNIFLSPNDEESQVEQISANDAAMIARAIGQLKQAETELPPEKDVAEITITRLANQIFSQMRAQSGRFKEFRDNDEEDEENEEHDDEEEENDRDEDEEKVVITPVKIISPEINGETNFRHEIESKVSAAFKQESETSEDSVKSERITESKTKEEINVEKEKNEVSADLKQETESQNEEVKSERITEFNNEEETNVEKEMKNEVSAALTQEAEDVVKSERIMELETTDEGNLEKETKNDKTAALKQESESVVDEVKSERVTELKTEKETNVETDTQQDMSAALTQESETNEKEVKSERITEMKAEEEAIVKKETKIDEAAALIQESEANEEVRSGRITELKTEEEANVEKETSNARSAALKQVLEMMEDATNNEKLNARIQEKPIVLRLKDQSMLQRIKEQLRLQTDGRQMTGQILSPVGYLSANGESYLLVRGKFGQMFGLLSSKAQLLTESEVTGKVMDKTLVPNTNQLKNSAIVEEIVTGDAKTINEGMSVDMVIGALKEEMKKQESMMEEKQHSRVRDRESVTSEMSGQIVKAQTNEQQMQMEAGKLISSQGVKSKIQSGKETSGSIRSDAEAIGRESQVRSEVIGQLERSRDQEERNREVSVSVRVEGEGPMSSSGSKTSRLTMSEAELGQLISDVDQLHSTMGSLTDEGAITKEMSVQVIGPITDGQQMQAEAGTLISQGVQSTIRSGAQTKGGRERADAVVISGSKTDSGVGALKRARGQEDRGREVSVSVRMEGEAPRSSSNFKTSRLTIPNINLGQLISRGDLNSNKPDVTVVALDEEGVRKVVRNDLSLIRSRGFFDGVNSGNIITSGGRNGGQNIISERLITSSLGNHGIEQQRHVPRTFFRRSKNNIGITPGYLVRTGKFGSLRVTSFAPPHTHEYVGLNSRRGNKYRTPDISHSQGFYPIRYKRDLKGFSLQPIATERRNEITRTSIRYTQQ